MGCKTVYVRPRPRCRGVAIPVAAGRSAVLTDFKKPALWLLSGVAYGIATRILFGYAPGFFGAPVVSMSFMFGTPFAVGAMVVYGLRGERPSIARMIVAPWLAILLVMLGLAASLLEGAVCLVLGAPLFLLISSLGGLFIGLVLRFSDKGRATLNSLLVLPVVTMFAEPMLPQHARLLEDRVAVDVAAPPQVIWRQILAARDIRPEELPASFTHRIGVPRPVEGVNVTTPAGEVRYSKWERGVSFSAIVTERSELRSISWRYRFDAASFPEGSLDDHVKIGGRFFDLHDTTFVLTPLSERVTKLEIISHYSVTTNLNIYAVPVARFIANDFMSTILGLYKTRSERAAKT